MLSVKEKYFFRLLVDTEERNPENIINMKRNREFDSYESFYKTRVKEIELIETAKIALAPHKITDILKIVEQIEGEIGSGTPEYHRAYQRIRSFLSSLYGGITTYSVVKRARYYLDTLNKYQEKAPQITSAENSQIKLKEVI